MFDFILLIILQLCVAYQECEDFHAPSKRDFNAAVIEYQPVPFNDQINAHNYLMLNVAKLHLFAQQLYTLKEETLQNSTIKQNDIRMNPKKRHHECSCLLSRRTA